MHRTSQCYQIVKFKFGMDWQDNVAESDIQKAWE